MAKKVDNSFEKKFDEASRALEIRPKSDRTVVAEQLKKAKALAHAFPIDPTEDPAKSWDFLLGHLRTSLESRVVAALAFISRLAIQKDAPASKIIEFAQLYSQAVRHIRQPLWIDFGAKILPKVLRRHTSCVFQFAEALADIMVQEVFRRDDKRLDERTFAYFFLRHLLDVRGYMVLKEFQKNDFRDFLHILAAEKPALQQPGEEMLWQLVRVAAHLDREDQRSFLSSPILRTLGEAASAKSPRMMELVYQTLALIFKTLSRSLFLPEDCRQIYDTVLDHLRRSGPRKALVFWRPFCQLFPEMVVNNPTVFQESGSLTKCLDILIKTVDDLGSRDSELALVLYPALTRVLGVYSEEAVLSFCELLVLKSIRLVDLWAKSKEEKPTVQAILDCLRLCFRYVRNVHLAKEETLNDFVDTLLIHSFNPATLDILEQLHRSPDPDFNRLLESKLRIVISLILKNDRSALDDDLQPQSPSAESRSPSRLLPPRNFVSQSIDKLKRFSQELEQDVLNESIRRLVGSQLEGRTGEFSNLKISLFKIRRGEFLKNFAQNLEKSHDDDRRKASGSGEMDQKISVALEALVKFDFGQLSNEKRTTFVKEAVFAYLESSSIELRKIAAKLVFRLSSAENPSHAVTLSLANKTLQAVADRMISLATGDPSDSVREETLTALNQQSARHFLPYLIRDEIVEQLIGLVSDPNSRIQKNAILLLLKAVPHSPKILQRFDLIIFRSLSQIQESEVRMQRDTRQPIRILYTVAQYASSILEDRVPVIISLLMRIMQSFTSRFAQGETDTQVTQTLSDSVKCLGILFDLRPDQSKLHFESFTQTFLRVREDLTEDLTKSFVKCMTTITRTSGCQLIFFVKYDGHRIIFSSLDKNVSGKVRTFWLRLLGTVGAVDPGVVERLESLRVRGSVHPKMSVEDIRLALRKVRKEGEWVQALNNQHIVQGCIKSSQTFRAFMNNVTLLTGQADPAELDAPVERHFQKKPQKKLPEDMPLDPLEDLGQTLHPADATLYRRYPGPKTSQILAAYTHRKLQADDDIPRFIGRETILFLLDVLRRETSDATITECLEALQRVVLILGKSAFEFSQLLLFSGIESFETFSSLSHRLLILRSLKHFVRASNLEIMRSPECVGRLLDLFVAHVETPELQPELIAICHLLVDHRALLKHCLRDVVTTLVNLVLVTPFGLNTPLAFDLLLRVDSPEYLHLITPALIHLLVNAKSGDTRQRQQLVGQVLTYFTNISFTHHFRHHLGSIIRACLQVGEKEEECREAIQTFLIDLLKSVKEVCLDYLPLMVPFLKGQPSFAKVIRQLEDKGHIEDPVLPNRIPGQRRLNSGAIDPEESVVIPSVLGFSFEAIRAAFVSEQMAKSDMSWDDWFHRLKTELILNSPSPVVQACSNLRFHVRATDGLFKPAFLALWSHLKDQQKSQMLRGFELILSAPSRIPLQIHQDLLSLIETLTVDGRFGCVLDIIKVVEFASKCHSLSKAIFFKELEFKKNPESAIKPLVLLYREAGYLDSAEGLTQWVQERVSPNSRERLLQSLGRWDLLSEVDSSVESPAVQIRQSIARSEWEVALLQIDTVLTGDSTHRTDPDIPRYSSMAALQLGKWEQLTRQPLKHPLDHEYYQSCVAISKGQYEEAQRRINEAFSLIEKGGQTFTNYAASYEQLVRLQSLVELEEIVRFKRRFDCTCQDELYEYMVTRDHHAQQRTTELAGLVATWSDRLVFMESKTRWVEEFLAVRSLVASKTALLPGYLQLADLYYQGGSQTAYKALIAKLKASFDSKPVPAILSLTEIESCLRLGEVGLDEAVRQAESLYLTLDSFSAERRHVYSKVGKWVATTDDRPTAVPTNFFERCLKNEQNDFELWHHYAICNYWMVKEAEAAKGDMNSKQLVNAIQGFAASLATNAPLSGQFTLQDLLRLLELWFDYQPGLSEQLQLAVDAAIKLVPTRLWLLIVRPLMTKLEASEAFLNSAKSLVASLAADYPQYLLFPLLLAAKSENRAKARLATRVLKQMELVDPKLIADASLFSEELIRVSVLFEELWYNGYCEIYKNRTEGKHAQSATLLGSLLERTFNSRTARTFNETIFVKKYGRHLLEMQELFNLYSATQSDLPLLKAWDIIANLYRELEASLKGETEFLYLENVSPGLLAFKNSSIVIPGTLKPESVRSVSVRVAAVSPTLRLLRSKRRPRKVSVIGSDRKKYSFLLKGNEDLRLDERMMQLLGLLNDLFKAGTVDPRNELKIGTFSVVPLSYESGLISWVENCDTVFELIREHRQRVRLNVNFEKMLYSQFVETYNQLSKTKKLEVYRFVAENSKADDLQKLFWQRALSADLWLSGRHTFTSSLAVMSMIGYIIGLGDRHLMNIMVERTSSLVIHIDFGDCFESAMLREKLPERIPFRLTRVLLNAMEVAQTEGTFRKISEKVMEIMRANRDVILAVLEEFVCDPILSWKVVQEQKGDPTPQEALEEDAFSFVEKPRISAEFVRKNKSKISMLELDSEAQVNIEKLEKDLRVNEKALEALNRIRRKLIGRDFGDEPLSVPAQVDRLIKEAVLPENICQAYIGWNPFL